MKLTPAEVTHIRRLLREDHEFNVGISTTEGRFRREMNQKLMKKFKIPPKTKGKRDGKTT